MLKMNEEIPKLVETLVQYLASVHPQHWSAPVNSYYYAEDSNSQLQSK